MNPPRETRAVPRAAVDRAVPGGALRPPRPWRRAGGWAALLLLLLGGCLPLPNLQLDLDVAPPDYRLRPEDVPSRYVRVDGYPELHTPAEFNGSGIIEYGLDEPIDTVVVLMPGIYGGAASFDVLARQLVASTPGVEVWAVDRRANLLEDLSGFRRSLAEGDPEIAARYYLQRRGQPDGFRLLTADEVDFMRHWGVTVHLRDLHRIVVAADRRARTVVLGGHSLGASIVSLYAAYEAAPASERRYGYEYIDGLVLLDGALGRTGGFAKDDVGIRFGPLQLTPSVADLAAGRGDPYTTLLQGPVAQIRRQVVALYGYLEPDVTVPEELFGFPASGSAVAGIFNDDEYAPLPLAGASLGHAVGATFSGNLTAFVLGGLEGARSRSVSGVAPGVDRVTWEPGDPARERTDLNAFVAAWSRADTNYSEWYFPLRLGLDMTLLPPALEGVDDFLPNRLVTVPTLALGAGRGLVPSLDGFRSYANIRYGSPITAYVLPGMTHIDIVTARNNPVVPVLQRWMLFLERVRPPAPRPASGAGGPSPQATSASARARRSQASSTSSARVLSIGEMRTTLP